MKNFKMSDDIYNLIKWVCLIFIPAFSTFLGVIGATCGIEAMPQIQTILSAFGVFMGTLIGVSTVNYNRGDRA